MATIAIVTISIVIVWLLLDAGVDVWEVVGITVGIICWACAKLALELVNG